MFCLPRAKRTIRPGFEDNQGAIALAETPLRYARSKHIDVCMCCSGGGLLGVRVSPAGLSLAVLRSWLALNVFSVRQCCQEPGRVFV